MHTYPEPDERFSKPLIGSVAFHAAVAAFVFLGGYLQLLTDKSKLGDINAGSPAFGEVTAVNTIPLPRRETRPNPVASDTETDVPPPKAKPREVVREDPDAIALKSKHKRKKEREREVRASNMVREEPIRPSQTTSTVGRAMSSDQFGIQGSGGVGLANNNPFGYRFGAYAGQLQRLVAAKWQAQGVNIRTANPAVVTVEIQRDGSFRVVSVAGSSGNYSVDTAARRALLDVGQFPPLPPGFDRSSAVVDFSFRVL